MFCSRKRPKKYQETQPLTYFRWDNIICVLESNHQNLTAPKGAVFLLLPIQRTLIFTKNIRLKVDYFLKADV
jgi:hypothetical protein